MPITLSNSDATCQELVYRQLREAILRGKFVPGHSITLRSVATMLGVSLTPVREALRRLVAERALEVHGNRRVSVPGMTSAKLAEICALRIVLETLAAERALPHVDRECLRQLWRLNEQVDEAVDAGDISAYLDRHREFHYTLYRAGDNRVTMPLIESLWLQFSPFMHLAIRHIGVDYINDRHAEGLHAIERRDVAGLRRALKADVNEGLGSLTEADFNDLVAASDR